MITREQIRELAQIECGEQEGCALSFYFQPFTPRNRSHKEEQILAKDLVRNALREAEKNGKNGSVREDLKRILSIAESLHGNQARAKAVFACPTQNFWREFDLPPQLPATQLFVNRRFFLKPLAILLGAQPRVAVVVVNRQRARLFDFRLDELTEREEMFHPVPRRVRSDGFGGYDAGHAERRVADEVMHHFKEVAERLKDESERGQWDQLIVGCPNEQWSEFDAQLHPYVKQRIIGRFSGDVAGTNGEHIREEAGRVLRDSLAKRKEDLVHDVLDQARSNSLGVTGLRRVLRSLEMGEVQTLLIGDGYRAHGIECPNCHHLDSHMLKSCPVCGHDTRELDDICEAIIPQAIQHDVELFYIKDNAEFDHAGNIAALLRFRANQNKNEIAAAS